MSREVGHDAFPSYDSGLARVQGPAIRSSSRRPPSEMTHPIHRATTRSSPEPSAPRARVADSSQGSGPALRRERPLVPPRLPRYSLPVERALGWMWPRPCLGCGDRAAQTRLDLCFNCAARLIPSPRPACRWCARRLDSSPPPGDGLCGSCRVSPRAGRTLGFSRLLTLLDYRTPFDRVMLAFKFGQRDYLGEPLARWCADQLSEELRLAGPFQLVVPVPLALGRRWQRGYNQSLLLARGFARRLGLPCRRLLRRRARPPQSLLPLKERRRNVRGTFTLKRTLKDPEPLGQRVLLVDDVVTSGATLWEAARCLRRGGASRVVAVALARTPDAELGPPR